MTKKLPIIFAILFSTFNFQLSTSLAFAQSNITNVYDISDKSAKNGDIMTFVPGQGIIRASAPYDNRMFGVFQDTPIAVFRRVDNTGQAVIRTGMATVNVSTLNGDIRAGDYITTSPIAGVGQKATTSGYAIGVALKDFNSQSGNQTNFQNKNIREGQIDVEIDIQFYDISGPRSFSTLFSGLGAAFLQSSQAPDAFGKAVKYIIVGLIMLLTILFDFIILSRSIPKTIEAIGRNPLGRSAIMFSLGLNLGMVALSLLVALAISFILIRL